MSEYRDGVSVTQTGTASIYVRVRDYDALASEFLDGGLEKPTVIDFTVFVENGEITGAERVRRGEKEKKYNWVDITDPMDERIEPEAVPDCVAEKTSKKVLGRENR